MTARRLLPFASLLVCGCGASGPDVQRFAGFTMGSTYEVKYVGPQPRAAVQQAVAAELDAFDAAFSRWRDDSEIAAVNRHASTEPLRVSARFASVLALALELAEATEGAFDPTVAPLTAVYRAAKAAGKPLDEAALAAVRPQVGHRHVRVRDGEVVKALPGVQLDLDGIVAGAATDAIAARLDALGVPAFYLEVTGEVYCRGEKARGVPWRIGVADPVAGAAGGNRPYLDVPLRDRALCTSGGYRNAIAADGRTWQHVFDPRTGRAAATPTVSASVLAASAAVADALGTAFLVLDEAAVQRVLPALGRYGELGVLLLVAMPDGTLRKVEVRWPA